MNTRLAIVTLVIFILPFSTLADAEKNEFLNQSPIRDTTIRLGGRLHIDAFFYKDGLQAAVSGMALRRSRVFIAGKTGRNWRFRSEYELAGESAEPVAAVIGYTGFDAIDWRLGLQTLPFGLEHTTSSNNIIFMERALPSELTPGDKVSATLFSKRSDWHGAAALALVNKNDDAGMSGHMWEVTSRVTASVVERNTFQIHAGLSGQYQSLSGTQIRRRARPEANYFKRRLVDTRAIEDVDNLYTFGAEMAGVWGGAVLFQGEYLQQYIVRNTSENLTFDGGYLLVSWLLPTAGTHSYQIKRGRLRPVRPRIESDGWELALRYSYLDLNDSDVTGGYQRDVTLGVNWYLNTNLRFMFNAVRAQADPSKHGVRELADIFQLRAQIQF